MVQDQAVERPGACRPGERRYYKTADGGVIVRQLSGDAGARIPAPPGAQEVTAEAGQKLLDDIAEAGRNARRERRDAAERLRLEAMTALLEAGVPADAARYLAGVRRG